MYRMMCCAALVVAGAATSVAARSRDEVARAYADLAEAGYSDSHAAALGCKMRSVR